MKTASAPLTALINGGQFCFWHLYSITLPNGLVLNLTSADFDIVDSGGTRYYCGSLNSGMPRVDSQSSRVTASLKAGLDAEQWQVQFMPTVKDPFTGVLSFPTAIGPGSIPWVQACQTGYFDGSTVAVQKAYFSAPPTLPWTRTKATPVGTTVEFMGYLGPVDASTTLTTFSFIGWGGLLDSMMPSNLYQSECRHQLFDSGCTLLASAFVRTGVALVGSSKTTLNATPAAPGGSGTYQRGTVLFTSGKNNGSRRMVTSWDGVSTFNFLYPLPFAITAGDTFNIYPGCDKSLGAGGCGGFNNKVNFGGEPFVPLPEIQIG